MIIKTDPSEFQNYLFDAANYKGNCEQVLIPESESEIVDIVLKANKEKTKITVSGNRTGLTGSAVPDGGIVISMEKLNKVLEINKEKMYAKIQPAVFLDEFQKLTEAENLFYPPDPTERSCFVGATVATNSSGAKSFRYGATRNFVIGIRTVLPDGEILNLERGNIFADNYTFNFNSASGKNYTFSIPEYEMPSTKNVAGYYCKPNMDLIDLFIGSEGTIGIITEIKLKLLPLPQSVLSCAVFFNSDIDALKFIEKARIVSYESRKQNYNSDIDALGLEFFDGGSLKFLSDSFPEIPQSANSAVWFEQETNSENEESHMEKWVELITEFNGDLDNSWFAFNEKEREKLKVFRHAVSWKVNEYIAKKNFHKVGTDTAVKDENMFAFFDFIKKLMQQNNMPNVIYGHLGNSHFHVNMLPENDEQFSTAKNCYFEICKKAVQFGGTVSAEHGIGKLKRKYFELMYNENEIRQMASLKKFFDKNLILNFGNIIDPKYYE
jgi:D-lactate dehydrogenase (cytochrome)